MKTLLAHWQTQLAAMSPRERRMAVIAAVVCAAVALLWLGEWVLKERARLTRQLPQAQAQLVQMQADAAELLRLSHETVPPAPTLDNLLAAIRAAANSRGLALEIELRGNVFTVHGTVAPAPLLDWLASLASEHRLRPQTLKIDSKTPLVEITATVAGGQP